MGRHYFGRGENMRIGRLIVLLVAATATAGVEVDAQLDEGERILGLVEIPRVFPQVFPNPDSPPREMGPVTLRSGPSSQAEEVAVLETPDQVESLEHSYEESSAVVYGYQRAEGQSWYGIRTASGQFGWLPQEEVGRFRPLAELFDDSLAYLTEDWDGRLFRVAGGGETGEAVRTTAGHTPIAIASSEMVGTEIYFLVVVLAESPCESMGPREVVAAGWVPAYSAADDLNLWYYSRGC